MSTQIVKKRRGAKKNLRAKQRNAERKVANIARNPVPWRVRGLTPAQRLAELDRQHGRGKGAAKERAKLAAIAKVNE
jgi:hypothetical protein